MHKSLLDKLRCPLSGHSLFVSGQFLVTDNVTSRYRYALKNNVPVMLPDEAVRLSEPEWHALKQNAR